MSVSSHHGKCFCGEVELMVKGAPMFQVYCHCTDCSLRHCAPFVKGVGYKHGEGIEVVKGKESVSSFNKSGEFERFFCTKCGTPLYNARPTAGFDDTFPQLFPTMTFNPSMHIWCKSQSIHIPDDLPRFADLPTLFGGSGKTMD